jgi:hypothetical protein
MKYTKRYLKAFTMCIAMFAFIISLAMVTFFGLAGFLGILTSSGDFIVALLLIFAAIVFGFIASMLNDLMEWLDKKFRPY